MTETKDYQTTSDVNSRIQQNFYAFPMFALNLHQMKAIGIILNIVRFWKLVVLKSADTADLKMKRD